MRLRCLGARAARGAHGKQVDSIAVLGFLATVLSIAQRRGALDQLIQVGLAR